LISTCVPLSTVVDSHVIFSVLFPAGESLFHALRNSTLDLSSVLLRVLIGGDSSRSITLFLSAHLSLPPNSISFILLLLHGFIGGALVDCRLAGFAFGLAGCGFSCRLDGFAFGLAGCGFSCRLDGFAFGLAGCGFGRRILFLRILDDLLTFTLARSKGREGRGRPFAFFHDSATPRSFLGFSSKKVLASGWEVFFRAAFIALNSTGFLQDLFS